MTEIEWKDEQVPREKIDPAISRKAYATAEAQLREAHSDEFYSLLDKAYADAGVESPRVKRERLAQLREAKRIAREADTLIKRQERAAALEEELAALKALLAAPAEEPEAEAVPA